MKIQDFLDRIMENTTKEQRRVGDIEFWIGDNKELDISYLSKFGFDRNIIVGLYELKEGETKY